MVVQLEIRIGGENSYYLFYIYGKFKLNTMEGCTLREMENGVKL